MESINNNQITTLQPNTDEELYELFNKELAKIHRKYHPQENDLFDMVDDKYKYRLSSLLGVEVV